jgi:HK97 family phage major capsid protein
MDLEQLRARLAEISARIAELGDSEDDVEEINALSEEFEGVTGKIEALERKAAIVAKAGQTTGRKAAGATPAATKPAAHAITLEDNARKDPKAGFKSAGEFFSAVRAHKVENKQDERFIKAGLMERNGEDGGILVPEDFRREIETKVQGEDSLLPLTRQIITNSNNVHIPTVESAPWDGTGIQAFWESERQKHKESDVKFGSETLKLHKLTAMVRVTEELLEDAPALESYLNAMAPEALVYKVNSAIIDGTGAGMPQGFLRATSGIIVPKESGQAADSLVFANVNNMVAHMNPAGFSRAIWFMNLALLPLLRTLKYDDGSPAYLMNGLSDAAPYGTLFGRPIRPMMSGMKALGDRGDIVLWDPKSYMTATKTNVIKSSSSVHVFWDTDEVAYKFQMRVAGQQMFKKPTKTEFGNFEVGGVVSLADRA